MEKPKKQRKPLTFTKKLFLQLTASLLLLSAIYFSKTYAPPLFDIIKSNLTYTPDLSSVTDAVETFILKYTPR